MSGLKTKDKVRGNPVVLGVIMMFFQMLELANEATKKQFAEFFPESTKLDPKTLQTFVCSRLKRAKQEMVRDSTLPAIPSRLLEIKEEFDESTERVKRKYYPRCWRCFRAK